MDNFFTSPSLLRLLKSKGIAATGTVRPNRNENSPLISVKEMKKNPGGTCDVVNDRNIQIYNKYTKNIHINLIMQARKYLLFNENIRCVKKCNF